MKMLYSIGLTVLLVCLCIALVFQFQRVRQPSGSDSQAWRSLVEKRFNDLAVIYEDPNRQADVLRFIQKELLDKHMAQSPQAFFDVAMNFYAQRGLTDSARELILSVVDKGFARSKENREGIDLAGAATFVHERLLDNPAEDVQWCETLRQRQVVDSPEFDLELDRWLLVDANALRDAELRKNTLKRLMERAPNEAGVRMIRSAMLPLCATDRAVAEQMADLLRGANQSVYAQLRAEVMIRLAIVKADWDAVSKLLLESRSILDDVQLHSALRATLEASRRARQLQHFESTLKELTFSVDARNQLHTLRLAAQAWCEVLYQRNRSDLVTGLEAMVDAKLPTEITAQILCQYFYYYIPKSHDAGQKADPAVVTTLAKFASIGQKIRSDLTPEHVYYDSVMLTLLDSAFLTENYQLSIQLLKAGIPGKDKAWADSLICKLQAHQAEKESRWLDAVASFRQFMEYIKTSGDDDTIDPATGVVYSRETLLARNERRIANLYVKAGKLEEAKASRAKARDLLQSALKKTKDEATRKMIQGEIALIPAD